MLKPVQLGKTRRAIKSSGLNFIMAPSSIQGGPLSELFSNMANKIPDAKISGFAPVCPVIVLDLIVLSCLLVYKSSAHQSVLCCLRTQSSRILKKRKIGLGAISLQDQTQAPNHLTWVHLTQ